MKTVILSHLHFDHTGSARAFTQASFVVGKGAGQALTSRMDGAEPAHTAWIPARQWREIDFADASPYATFSRSIDLFDDGSIRLLAAEGHTAGDLAALVQLPQGPALLTGDAVVHFDWLRSQDVQRIVQHPEQAAEVRNRVRALQMADSSVVILPGHDLTGVPLHRTDLIVHQPHLFSVEAWPIH